MGYILRGQFHLLFHAGSSLKEVLLGVDVPSTFSPLTIGRIVRRNPRPPGCLHAGAVEVYGAGLEATVPTPLYVLSFGPYSTYLNSVPHSSLNPGAHFSISLTGDHGAALRTRYPTYREDTRYEAMFEAYTKRHYGSWVTFAREKGYGDDIRPILVSGFDMTKDFAMLAYSNKGVSLEAGLQTDIPMITSVSAFFAVTRHVKCAPHFNYGPLPWGSNSAIGFPSSQLADPRAIRRGFDQCVFLRYYTLRTRKWIPPKVIRAGAGPHDLGSGDNREDTSPELTVQSDGEPTTSGDEDLGGQSDPTADGTSSGVVVRNAPYVWSLLRTLISALTFVSRTCVTAGMPLQITYSR